MLISNHEESIQRCILVVTKHQPPRNPSTENPVSHTENEIGIETRERIPHFDVDGIRKEKKDNGTIQW